MRKHLAHLVRKDLTFFLSLLFLTVIPLFPEYCAPVLAIGSLCAAVKDAHNRQTTVKLGTLGKSILLFILYQLFTAIYSQHVGNTLSTVAMWSVMFCGYLALTTTVHNQQRLHTVFLFIGTVAGIVGLISCSQYVLRNIFAQKLPNQIWYTLDKKLYAIFPMNIDLHLGFDRSAATFNNPNILAEYLIMVIPFVGYSGFTGPRTKQSLFMRGCTVLAVLGAVISFSRGSYIALLSMLLLILALNFKHLTPFVLCLVAAVSLIPEAVTSRFLSIGATTADHAITERFDVWNVAVQTIIERPLFGLGAGISNFWECLQNTNINAPHSHNLILQMLVEGGFIMLFLMCIVFTKFLQNGLELTDCHNRGRSLGVTLTMFIIAFAVHGMVDYPFLSPKLVGAFLMVIGIADAVSPLYLYSSSPMVSFIRYPATLFQSVRQRFKSRKKSPQADP
ncbi:MAG: O-antigen ligase family protein [Clostridia bacterium]|nr:O-antigen ligase family protein [Clostridia bacterium]